MEIWEANAKERRVIWVNCVRMMVENRNILNWIDVKMNVLRRERGIYFAIIFYCKAEGSRVSKCRCLPTHQVENCKLLLVCTGEGHRRVWIADIAGAWNQCNRHKPKTNCMFQQHWRNSISSVFVHIFNICYQLSKLQNITFNVYLRSNLNGNKIVAVVLILL